MSKQSKSHEPDALALVCIAKAVKDKAYSEARAELLPGASEINLLASLRGMLTVAPDVPGGPASSRSPSFDPWLLLAIAMKQLDEAEVEGIAKAAVIRMKRESTSTTVLQAMFAAEAEKRLPKIFVAGGAGRRGSVSFAGSIELP